MFWASLLAPLATIAQPLSRSAPTPITTAKAILGLPSDQAASRLPCRIRGVVTASALHGDLLFVQDSTAGIYVYTTVVLPRPGDDVEIQGHSDQGLFSPILVAESVTTIGSAALPPARPVAIEQLAFGQHDSQWVEVEGIVMRQSIDWGHLVLLLASGSARLEVRIIEFDPAQPVNWVDARVKVRGVAGTAYNNQRQLVAFHLLTQTTNLIEVLRPPTPNPYSLPLRSSTSLMAYSPDGGSQHRTRLQGVVTWSWPGNGFFLKDNEGDVRIHSNQKEPLVPGDIVEAVGFPAPTFNRPVLQEAVFRKTGQTNSPQPLPITAPVAATGAHDAELVALEGVVLKAGEQHNDHAAIVVEADQKVFRLRHQDSWPLPNAADLVGSRIRAVGICTKDSLPPSTSDEFSLWLRSAKDIEVLERPALWRQRRAKWVLGGLGGAVLLGAAWIAFLRHQVRIHRETGEALRSSERQLRASLEEREHLGRDLHDGIIQSIYAAGLNLEDCARMVKPDPEAVERRLKAVTVDLNRVIRDVRNFIVRLEQAPLSGEEFKRVLHSIALTVGESHAIRIELNIDDVVAASLRSSQTTHLLHIAREAASNSVRHGAARTLTFLLNRSATGIHFEVADDGTGFDPSDDHRKGRGLRNIAARASQMDALLRIESRPGQGTRTILEIPDDKKP